MCTFKRTDGVKRHDWIICNGKISSSSSGKDENPPVIHPTENSDDLVVRPLRLEVDLVNHLRPEVVLVLDDGSAALPVAVAAHREDVASAGQSQSMRAT